MPETATPITYRTAFGEIRSGTLVVRYGSTVYVRDAERGIVSVPTTRLGK